MNRGKLVIVGILGVALVAAGFSTWYHYRGQHRAMEFWGPPTARLIVEGPEIKALELGEPAPSPEENGDEPAVEPAVETAGETPAADDAAPPEPKAVEFDHTDWKILAAKPLAGAKGGANIRRALVLDTTFDWKPAVADEPRWQYALAVNDGRHWATVLFDFESRQVALAGGRKTALLDPAANDDLRKFFAEQFPPESAAADTPTEKAAEASSASAAPTQPVESEKTDVAK